MKQRVFFSTVAFLFSSPVQGTERAVFRHDDHLGFKEAIFDLSILDAADDMMPEGLKEGFLVTSRSATMAYLTTASSKIASLSTSDELSATEFQEAG